MPASGGLGGARDATGALVFGGLSQMLADPNIPQATKDAIQQQGALTARAATAAPRRASSVTRRLLETHRAPRHPLRSSDGLRLETLADLNRQSNIGFEPEAPAAQGNGVVGAVELLRADEF